MDILTVWIHLFPTKLGGEFLRKNSIFSSEKGERDVGQGDGGFDDNMFKAEKDGGLQNYSKPHVTVHFGRYPTNFLTAS